MPRSGMAIPGRSARDRTWSSWSDHSHPGIRGPAKHLDAELSLLWLHHGDSYLQRVTRSGTVTRSAFKRELLFCLLGGHGVTYELALSATTVLWERGVFRWCDRRGDSLRRYTADLLSRPLFDPPKQDGSRRRFRYPNRKAAIVSQANDWVLTEGSTALRQLAVMEEPQMRIFLTQCPGIGPKTASWLLRNTGLAQNLAVLDTHVLDAMEEVGLLQNPRLPRDYVDVERTFLRWCQEIGAAPAAFDLFLWEWHRGDLTCPTFLSSEASTTSHFRHRENLATE